MSKKKTKSQSFSIDDIEKEEKLTPDQAAARSRSYKFDGKKIQGFSQDRQVAAASMGVKVCSSAFASIADELEETGSYPEMFADAIAVVWLCTQPAIEAHRAVRKKDAATEKSLKWWSSFQANVGSQTYVELMELFANIIEDVFAVSADTDSKSSGGKSAGLGE
jgi:hypothetical protein